MIGFLCLLNFYSVLDIVMLRYCGTRLFSFKKYCVLFIFVVSHLSAWHSSSSFSFGCLELQFLPILYVLRNLKAAQFLNYCSPSELRVLPTRRQPSLWLKTQRDHYEDFCVLLCLAPSFLLFCSTDISCCSSSKPKFPFIHPIKQCPLFQQQFVVWKVLPDGKLGWM